MVLISMFKLEGGKVRDNDWLASVWSVRLGCCIVLYTGRKTVTLQAGSGVG